MKTVRILSIDGGGMRNLHAALVWAAIERAAGAAPLSSMFDMVAGTSAGALIGAALVKPDPLRGSDIADFFIREGRTIFSSDLFRYVKSAVTGPKYSAEPFEKLLDQVFGNDWISDSTVPFIVPAYDLTGRQAHFFKSWKAGGKQLDPGETREMNDYRFKDLVRASAAAPTYFEPARIKSGTGVLATFADGALVANNPAMCAIASARTLHPDMEKLVVVSIGTGMQTEPITYAQSRGWGLLEWARPAFECVMDGVGDTVPYQVRECFGGMVTQYRFDFILGGANPSGAIDDASSQQIRRLITAAQDTIAMHGSTINALPRMLMNQTS